MYLRSFLRTPRTDLSKKSKRNPYWTFLSDPGVPGVRSMGPDVRTRGFADLTDVTLAGEDSNSIPTDDVNGQSQAI